MPDKIYIYGDSLLKATVPDVDFHYHFHINEVMQRYQTKLVEVVNRSKMGATIRKGLSLVRHDLDRGLEAGTPWCPTAATTATMTGPPLTPTPAPTTGPTRSCRCLPTPCTRPWTPCARAAWQPVMMTLPPIDGERYLSFLCRDNLRRDRILSWLGEPQMIYRHQELYADTAAEIALPGEYSPDPGAANLPVQPSPVAAYCRRRHSPDHAGV